MCMQAEALMQGPLPLHPPLPPRAPQPIPISFGPQQQTGNLHSLLGVQTPFCAAAGPSAILQLSWHCFAQANV